MKLTDASFAYETRSGPSRRMASALSEFYMVESTDRHIWLQALIDTSLLHDEIQKQKSDIESRNCACPCCKRIYVDVQWWNIVNSSRAALVKTGFDWYGNPKPVSKDEEVQDVA